MDEMVITASAPEQYAYSGLAWFAAGALFLYFVFSQK